jgi:hypothetical protein
MLYYALVFLIVGLIADALNLAGVSTVAAAECRVTDLIDGGTIQGMPTWKGTTLSILPLTITVERDFYGGLVPSRVLEIAPYMKSSRIVLGKTENQTITGACLSQDIRKSALYNQAMIRSSVKSPAKARTQFMKVPTLLYNEKKQGLTIRTTPQEIRISARYKADTLIGPVQDIGKSVLSDNRTVNQPVATLLSTVEYPLLFGGQAFVASNPFQSEIPMRDNESLRMNQTSMRALHQGNCASGCP